MSGNVVSGDVGREKVHPEYFPAIMTIMSCWLWGRTFSGRLAAAASLMDKRNVIVVLGSQRRL